MQELHMWNSDTVEVQATVLAECSCALASPKACVLGSERLQGLATSRR